MGGRRVGFGRRGGFGFFRRGSRLRRRRDRREGGPARRHRHRRIEMRRFVFFRPAEVVEKDQEAKERRHQAGSDRQTLDDLAALFGIEVGFARFDTRYTGAFRFACLAHVGRSLFFTRATTSSASARAMPQRSAMVDAS
jgi:hypothetical protein